MKTVAVAFKKAEIARFDPRTGVAEVQFTIHDGKDKMLVKHTKFDEASEAWAGALIKEVRQKISRAHKTADWDDDVLSGVVNIKFANEDALLERLIRFHAILHDKIRGATMTKMAFYEVERKLVGVKVMFDGSESAGKRAGLR